MISIKAGVKLDDLRPQILLGILIASSVYGKHGLDFTITSVSDGKHMLNSKHYVGQAFDIRTRGIRIELVYTLVEEIRVALGDNFDVVLEDSHIHAEFDPKG